MVLSERTHPTQVRSEFRDLRETKPTSLGSLAAVARLAVATKPVSRLQDPMLRSVSTKTEVINWLGTALLSEREKRFHALSDWWHDATDALSITTEKLNHPAYRRILNDLGEDAIPFILEELRDRGGHWFHALSELTGLPPAPFQAQGDLQRVTDFWLTWGRANEYI